MRVCVRVSNLFIFIILTQLYKYKRKEPLAKIISQKSGTKKYAKQNGIKTNIRDDKAISLE